MELLLLALVLTSAGEAQAGTGTYVFNLTRTKLGCVACCSVGTRLSRGWGESLS